MVWIPNGTRTVWYQPCCRGTHQRFAPGRGNQVHFIWPTYFALTPTLDLYLRRLGSSRGCAISAIAAITPQAQHPPTM